MRLALLLVAISLSLLYISLSPGAIAGMGYTGEEMATGNQILSLLSGGSPALKMSRNGLLPVFVDLPFLAAGALFERRDAGQDLVLSSQPGILTALIVALSGLWIYRRTQRPVYSVLMALAAAFCSMLFPYAYIGLETKQSFFLLAAAFLAIEFDNPSSWLAVLSFAVAAAMAVGSKSTGAFLWPATAFLLWVYGSRMRDRGLGRHGIAFRLAIIAAVPVALFLLNTHWRSQFWGPVGGTRSFVELWRAPGFVWPALNFASFFGSPNKGLWIFSPLCLLGCYALPHCWRSHRRLAILALLTLGGLAGGFSLLRNWSDETWGPRYLHTSIAPLLIVFAIAWSERLPLARTLFALVAAAGFIAAALGVFAPYTALPVAVIQTGQNTLEAYQGDIHLNHLRFNARLFELWLNPKADGTWTSERQWFFDRPKDAPPPKTLDLRAFAIPQPFLVRNWREPKIGPVGRLYLFNTLCLAAGLVLLAIGLRRAYRLTPATNPTPSPAATQSASYTGPAT